MDTLIQYAPFQLIDDITEYDLENHYLLNCPTICVDVETQTETDSAEWRSHKYGVSYVADIVVVSLHAEGFPTVVLFDIEADDDRGARKREFIKRVLTQPNLTIIGHNVVFDLRALGGHIGFNYLNAGAANRPKVWDTMINALLVMLIHDPKNSGLETIARQYNLIGQPEDEIFYANMKGSRADISNLDMESVVRYVAMDAQITYRLYALERAIINTSGDKTAEPQIQWYDDGRWEIVIAYPSDRPSKFVSSKAWKTLPELVEWEQRKLWIASTMAINGMKLDVDYVKRHREELLGSLANSLNRIVEIIHNDPTHDEVTKYLLPYAVALACRSAGKFPKTQKWFYSTDLLSQAPDWFKPMPEDFMYPSMVRGEGEQAQVVISENNQETVLAPVNSIVSIQQVPEHFDLAEWLYWRTSAFQGDPDGRWKAKIKAKWYEDYFTFTKPVDLMKLINKDAFQMWYVFVVQNVSPPSISEIVDNTFLVTPKLRELVDNATFEKDWRQMALDGNYWSLSEDALDYYFGKDDDGVPRDDLMLVMHQQAQITRIDEFLRHAARDGRIHSIVAPKATTSRATHTSMNLGNLPMKQCRGYLVVDDPAHWVQFSIDISNAENWFSALTFADNALAEACASGDFHWAMMEVYRYMLPDGSYKPEYLDMLAKIKAGGEEGHKIFQQLKDERKWLKRVTFGGGYGAGARKISRMLGCTVQEAQELLDARDRRFRKYSEGKRAISEHAEKLFKAGFNPPFQQAWSGRRIPIPVRTVVRNGEPQVRVEGYKGVNYAQQSGVAELVWRAMVLAQEQALDSGMSLKIVNQVHDEIVGQCLIEEFWPTVQLIIKHIYEIVPEAYRNRTIPACRFLAAIGPENADKWGYQDGIAYPIDKTRFANYWGVWDMPAGAEEAPTWVGPVHEGYTVQNEIMSRMLDDALASIDDPTVTVDKLPMWQALNHTYTGLAAAVDKLLEHRAPVNITVGDQTLGPFFFSERMAVYQVLAQRGHEVNAEYWDLWQDLGGVVDAARKFIQWWVKFAPIPTPAEREA